MTLALPVTPKHVHEGGVLCGQTMMAACRHRHGAGGDDPAGRLQADDHGAAADQLPAPGVGPQRLRRA
ncbi:MAG: hypothetical protein MZW92_70695 [Comamonadaceae bacterium]|nr:hypothetical protein [Comamonadaceae bacterium]